MPSRLRAFVIVASTVLALAEPVRAQPRPNIILIQADDLGYGDLGSYGQTKFATPNLDRLAAEGTRFTQYYSGSTVCAPSRAALMLGQHTGHNWIRGNGEIPLRPEDVTLPEVLRAAGYRTAVVGKWGLGREDTAGRPGLQGVDHFFGFLDHRHAHRQYVTHLWRDETRVDYDVTRDYANDLFTADALEFVSATAAQPFFLYLAYTAPHAELRVPEDSLAEYRGRYPETPFVDAAADAYTPVPPFERTGYRSQPTPHAAFAAMIARMDRDIGRLMSTLTRLGIDRQTLVLFTSDNGPHRGRRRRPGVFQQQRRLARHQARSLRGRHPRADDRVGAGTGAGRGHQRARLGALGHVADAGGSCRRQGPRWPRRHLDAGRAGGPAGAGARVSVLGVSRTRIPAGRADGAVEGGAAEEWRGAGTVRSRRGRRRNARRRCASSRRRGSRRRATSRARGQSRNDRRAWAIGALPP